MSWGKAIGPCLFAWGPLPHLHPAKGPSLRSIPFRTWQRNRLHYVAIKQHPKRAAPLRDNLCFHPCIHFEPNTLCFMLCTDDQISRKVDATPANPYHPNSARPRLSLRFPGANLTTSRKLSRVFLGTQKGELRRTYASLRELHCYRVSAYAEAVPTQKAYAAYANCAGTLFQPTRLRALQKKLCSTHIGSAYCLHQLSSPSGWSYLSCCTL